MPEWIDESAAPLYHAALAHGANHLVTLVNEAVDRLRDAGVARPEKVLAPLLRAALDNALRLGDAALTGPVSRGDAATVAGHLDALAGSRRSRCRPIWRWPAAPPTGRSPTAGCGRRTRNCCSASWPDRRKEERRMTELVHDPRRAGGGTGRAAKAASAS